MITFVTRRACPLCEERLPWVLAAAERRDRRLTVVDVDDAGLAEEYGERVPVVLVEEEVVLEGDFTRRDAIDALG